jgi:phage head maturation protease
VLTEASDVRGLLDHDTTVIGLRGNDTTDLTLRDDRVSSRGESYNAEELFNILEATRNLVEEEL